MLAQSRDLDKGVWGQSSLRRRGRALMVGERIGICTLRDLRRAVLGMLQASSWDTQMLIRCRCCLRFVVDRWRGRIGYLRLGR